MMAAGIALLSCNVAPSYAQNNEHPTKKKYFANVFDLPTLEPDISATLGFSHASYSGSKTRAAEFEYMKDSAYFSANHMIMPFPNRFYFEAEALNSKDQFWDLRYAYSDIVLARYVRRSIYHNLETYRLVDMDASTASPSVSNPDAEEDYGLNVNIGELSVRLKSPGYPFHVFIKDHYVHKEGEVQQRFISGSGYFNDVVRATRGRRIEWDSHEYTLGTNAHLGPAEMEISRTEKRFDPSGDDSLYDAYTAGSSRSAGTYLHNLYPTLKGDTSTLKLHTSYTGRLVASVALSDTNRFNTDSDAAAHYLSGSGQLFARPFDRVIVALKFKRVKSEPNNPDSLPVGYLGVASYVSSITGVRDSLETDKDTYTMDVRYAASPRTSIVAEYLYKNTSRANGDDWDLPGKSIERTMSIAGRTKPISQLKLEMKLTGQENSDPAYNITPDTARNGSISASLKPDAGMQAFLKYSREHGRSDDTTISTDEAGSRLTDTDKAYGSVTLWPADSLSLTAGAAYTTNRIQEDAYFGDTFEQGIRYRDSVYSYTAGANFVANEKLTLSFVARLTRSRGGFSSDTLSYTDLSDISAKETDYTLTGSYALNGGWDAGLEIKRATYDNMIEDYENPELTDGSASRVLMKLSKEFR